MMTSPGAIPTTQPSLQPPKFQWAPKVAVGLVGEAASPRWQPLFKSLAELFPVEFHSDSEISPSALQAVIAFGRSGDTDLGHTPKGLPAYVAFDGAAEGSSATSEVRFSDSPWIDRCLRNEAMEDRELKSAAPIALVAGDDVVATRGGQPLWIRRKGQTQTLDLLAFLPPAIAPGDFLFKYYMPGRFIRLLPLLVFLKRLTAPVAWQTPGKKACFIFDDPSMYWTSYGFLDFRRLADHARAHDYYTAIATIPIDTWWMSPAPLKIFRDNAPRLSLLIHGNNHLKHEMADSNSPTGSVEVLAQALRRFDRLERKEGLEACRVMEAPHAALAEATLRSMRQLDFEGALATPELLLHYNRNTAWPATLGLEPSNMLAGGLSTLPRIKMTREWRTAVRLAAVLDQPIVLVGHHEDAAEGMNLQADFAKIINNFGGVEWASPRGILRANYTQWRDGDSLHVRMYSSRITVAVPEGVRTVWVHRPWLPDGGSGEVLALPGACKQDPFANLDRPVSGPIVVDSAKTLEVASLLKNPIDYKAAKPPPLRLWPIPRKVMAEFRDRIRPLNPRKPAPGAGFEPMN